MSESILKAEGVFRWFKPGAERDDSQLVAGTLEVATNGVSTLSLTGLLPDDTDTRSLSFAPQPLDQDRWIVGALKDSRYVFLRRLASDGTTYGAALSHEGFKARDCVVFQHLDVFPDLDKVSKLMVSLDFLGDWASEPAVKVTKTRGGAASSASKPKAQTFKLPGKTLSLKTSISYTAPADSYFREATIRQRTHYESEPKAPQTLEAVRDDFHLLEDVLLMLSDVDVALPWPTVWYDRSPGTYYFERRRTDPQKVDILKSWSALTWLGKGNGIDLGTLLTNLQAQQEILGPGLYLYLGIQRASGLYLENRFSTAMFGLESLHRRVGTTPTQAGLQEKIDRIINDVQLKKDKDWLRARFRNAAEPSLEERLFLTFSELDIGLEPTALRAFAKECADLRNQVAHFGGERHGVSATYEAFVLRMYVLNEALRPLYHAVLLNRIGFDADRIRGYFHRSPYSTQRKLKMKEAGLVFVVPPPPAKPAAAPAAAEPPAAPQDAQS